MTPQRLPQCSTGYVLLYALLSFCMPILGMAGCADRNEPDVFYDRKPSEAYSPSQSLAVGATLHLNVKRVLDPEYALPKDMPTRLVGVESDDPDIVSVRGVDLETGEFLVRAKRSGTTDIEVETAEYGTIDIEVNVRKVVSGSLGGSSCISESPFVVGDEVLLIYTLYDAKDRPLIASDMNPVLSDPQDALVPLSETTGRPTDKWGEHKRFAAAKPGTVSITLDVARTPRVLEFVEPQQIDESSLELHMGSSGTIEYRHGGSVGLSLHHFVDGQKICAERSGHIGLGDLLGIELSSQTPEICGFEESKLRMHGPGTCTVQAVSQNTNAGEGLTATATVELAED